MVYFYFLNANGAARRSHDSSVPSFGQVLGTVTTHTAKFMLWFDLAATSSPYSCKGCTATLATKLVQSIAQPFVIGDHKLEIGVSIGITMYPDDCKIGEELTRKADQAMYAAKQIGGGSYRFYRNTLS
jgi:GGDEF domain-containing protein